MKLRNFAIRTDCFNSITVVQHVAYYPYGEPWSEPGGQPMLFGGKERESRSKNSLYGPRQYSAAALRWWAPDLKARDYTPQSPYTFCASNPILFTDPTGMEIRISGNVSQKMLEAIIADLNTLSENKIAYREKDGYYECYIAEECADPKLSGTGLVTDVINSKTVVTISTNDEFGLRSSDTEAQHSKWYYAGKGYKRGEGYINYNNKSSRVRTLNGKGKLIKTDSPSYIGLGHELIHAYRDITHIKASGKSKNPYTQRPENTEDLRTIGIENDGCKYNENRLRQEHNLPLRGSHYESKAAEYFDR